MSICLFKSKIKSLPHIRAWLCSRYGLGVGFYGQESDKSIKTYLVCDILEGTFHLYLMFSFKLNIAGLIGENLQSFRPLLWSSSVVWLPTRWWYGQYGWGIMIAVRQGPPSRRSWSFPPDSCSYPWSSSSMCCSEWEVNCTCHHLCSKMVCRPLLHRIQTTWAQLTTHESYPDWCNVLGSPHECV